MRNPSRSAPVAWASLTLLLLLSFSTAASASETLLDITQMFERIDWMAWVPDDVRISELSIPGTHDTMADNGGSVGSPIDEFVQTQDRGLTEQLERGVRYTDIRVRRTNDSNPRRWFAIHHGPVFLGDFFDDVLDDMQAFLALHPNETILMRLKEDHTAQSGAESMSTIFNWYRDEYPGLFWVPPDVTPVAIPTLGDVRGKILVIQEFGTPSPIGLHWNQLEKYDDFHVPRFESDDEKDIDEHWDGAEDHLEDTRDGSLGNIYLTHLSGNGLTNDDIDAGLIVDLLTDPPPTPIDIALGPTSSVIMAVLNGILCDPIEFLDICDVDTPSLNRSARNWLVGGSTTRRAGIVVMDFPLSAALDSVISFNMQFAEELTSLAPFFDQTFPGVSFGALSGSGLQRFYERVTEAELWHYIEPSLGACESGFPPTLGECECWATAVDTDGLYGALTGFTELELFSTAKNFPSVDVSEVTDLVVDFLVDNPPSNGNLCQVSQDLQLALDGAWGDPRWGVLIHDADQAVASSLPTLLFDSESGGFRVSVWGVDGRCPPLATGLTEIYVDAGTTSRCNSGTQQAPLTTVRDALSAAASGAVIRLRAGTYPVGNAIDEAVSFRVWGSGTASLVR